MRMEARFLERAVEDRVHGSGAVEPRVDEIEIGAVVARVGEGVSLRRPVPRVIDAETDPEIPLGAVERVRDDRRRRPVARRPTTHIHAEVDAVAAAARPLGQLADQVLGTSGAGDAHEGAGE